MNLIIDIGNTMVKVAVADGERIVAQHCTDRFRPAAMDELLAAWPDVDKAVVCSTRSNAGAVAASLRRKVGYCLEFSACTPVPLRNAYRTPETLGRDRLAAAVGAVGLFPERNLFIVDFGTALTLDLVTADGTFRGGFISPGVGSRFRSLHDYTAKLPLCAPTEELLPLGVTTVSAVVQGVMDGVAYEIEGHIARMAAEYENLCTIFTGGDAKYFVKRIKNTIFADCNLVFRGLNRILEYNASEKNPD